MRKSSRLAKRFVSAFLVKSRRLSVTSLPSSSRYSTRSATIVTRDAVDVDLLARRAAGAGW